MDYLIAQVATGNELSLDTLESSLELFRATGQGWDRIWNLVVNPTQPLWVASVYISRLIMGFSLFFYAFLILSKIDQFANPRVILDWMPLPLTLAFFFAGNGTMLSALVLGVRSLFQGFGVTVLRIQINGISINQTISTIQSTGIANDRARVIFADCLSLTGKEFTDCLQDPVKLEQARQLLAAQPQNLLSGNVLDTVINIVTAIPGAITNAATSFIGSTVATIFGTPAFTIVRLILLGWQHVFVNIIEATLVLTAISAPIFLSLSLFTVNAPLFFLWLTSYLGLFFTQLAYISLVGIYALLVSQLDQAGVPLGSIVTDFVFLLFIAIFAPLVAVGIAMGGGIKLYEQLSSNAVHSVAWFLSIL